jgi:excisionase family DNA binding protein
MANDNLKDCMFTVREVSLLLHVHPNTLRRWADKGIIKSLCITPRGDRRFMSRDINQFLAQMNAQNHPSTTQTSISSSTSDQAIEI